MKTIQELRAFCEGVIARIDEDDLPSMDDWIMWGGYDINLAGYNPVSYTHLTLPTILRV